MKYLASPYSHADPLVREIRFQKAAWAASVLIRSGQVVFAPIPHSHPITKYGVPGSWEYWAEFDKKLLAICEELVILTLDGWEQSTGIAAETAWAKELGKPVVYYSEEDIRVIEKMSEAEENNH